MRIAFLLCVLTAIPLAAADVLTLERTIPLPGVAGRIDHLVVDQGRNRLLVAALGNGSVEVVDLNAHRVIKSIAGLEEPQGIAVVSAVNRVFVACGGGQLKVYDAENLKAVATISFDGDADNVRYLDDRQKLYVGHGDGGLAVVDVMTNKTVGEISLEAHPESFQLEANGLRGFVNVPRAHHVAVVDLNSRKITGQWSLGLAAANYPMAFDEAGHRLFVGCRLPGRLLVFDTDTGREVARLDLRGDCDDLFFDAARQWVVATCGAGSVDIFSKTEANQYRAIASVKTAAGARTGLLHDDILYVAVPKSGNQPAEIRCYRLAAAPAH